MINHEDHWKSIYKKNNFKNFSWYQEKPDSIKLINSLKLKKDVKIFDVGAGTSYLANKLMEDGYKNITINDISLESIEISRHQSWNRFNWLVGDITKIDLPKNYFNVWHDRAVFHFLTERSDRVNYINQILKSTEENSYVIISVFSYEGPKTCSSLPVKQYDENSLSSELGKSFEILKFSYHDHFTPANKKQNFISCCFKVIN